MPTCSSTSLDDSLSFSASSTPWDLKCNNRNLRTKRIEAKHEYKGGRDRNQEWEEILLYSGRYKNQEERNYCIGEIPST